MAPELTEQQKEQHHALEPSVKQPAAKSHDNSEGENYDELVPDSNSKRKQLIASLGKTLLDLIVTQGTRGLMKFVGGAEEATDISSYKNHKAPSPPPPGEPEFEKVKRNLESPKTVSFKSHPTPIKWKTLR